MKIIRGLSLLSLASTLTCTSTHAAGFFDSILKGLRSGTLIGVAVDGKKIPIGGQTTLELKFQESHVNCSIQVDWGEKSFGYTFTPENRIKERNVDYRIVYNYNEAGVKKIIIKSIENEDSSYPPCSFSPNPFEAAEVYVLSSEEIKAENERIIKEKEAAEKQKEEKLNQLISKSKSLSTFIVCEDKYRTGAAFKFVEILAGMVGNRSIDFRQIEPAVYNSGFGCRFQELPVSKSSVNYRNSNVVYGGKFDVIAHNIDGYYMAVIIPGHN